VAVGVPVRNFPNAATRRVRMKKKVVKSDAPHKNARTSRAEVSGLELDARRAQRLKAAEVLQGGRTPLQLIEVAAHATTIAEQAVRQAMEADPPPPLACKEGCDWCCHLTVGTSVPEVVRIVAYLRETLSPEELLAMRERVARTDDDRRRLPLDRRADARLPCPLLVEHRCSAYPVRPLTCRGFNSSDASRCEQFVKSRARVQIPMYHPQQRLMTFVLDGTRAALQASGLKDDLLDLKPALRIALDVPDALERWLTGQPVFAPARLD
jgi:Fe-S-cluster containining protein